MPQYIPLKREDIQKLSKEYGLAITEYELLSGGASTTSIVLRTAEEQSVLTLFDDKTGDEVSRIARTLCVLEEHSFPATRLIPTTTGALMTEYADYFVILKKYITGVHQEDLSQKALAQIGEMLAKLHLLPPPDFLLEAFPYALNFFPIISNRNLDPDYEAWLAARNLFFVKNLPDHLPRGMIHADMFYDNVLFENGELKAFLDFEDICNDYFVFDVATALMGLCREGTALNLEKAMAFAYGYSRRRPLEEGELGALQLWTDYAATGMSAWRFWKYRIQFSIPEKENAHWEMVHFADHVRAIPEDQFLGMVGANPADLL